MFRLEDLKENIREPFVGVVVRAEYPCKCPICEKGYRILEEMGRDIRTLEKIHIVIKPIEKYEKLQHAWYGKSKIKFSSLGAFTIALNEYLKFVPKSNDPEKQWLEVKKYLEGRTFEWESVKPADFVLNYLIKMNPAKEKDYKAIYASLPQGLREAKETWIPVREISREQLEELGITNIDEIIEEAKEELEYEEGGNEGISSEQVEDIVYNL